MPYYALSWILTWFSHDFEDYQKVVRLFDVFVSSQALMPVFTASAVRYLVISIIIIKCIVFVNRASNGCHRLHFYAETRF